MKNQKYSVRLNDDERKILQNFILESIERILNRKKREVPPVEPKITGNVEAHIIATTCSEPPKGRKAWTLELIAEKVVLDGVLDSLSDTSVKRTLKKHNISLT